MFRTLIALFLLFFSFQASAALNLSPAEGASLHYRIVRFGLPGLRKNEVCTLEVALGEYNDVEAFSRNVVIRKVQQGGAIIAEVPRFGAKYTWRITGPDRASARFFHFSTLSNLFTDSLFTLSVNRRSGDLSASYFFMDCSRALHDMNGNVVWFLPATTDNPAMPGGVQDLKATAYGTITYLMGTKMYETSYDGSFLRVISDSGLSVGNRGLIHHEGTRMTDGHYMVLGYENLYWKEDARKIKLKRTADSAGGYEPQMFGVISEIDSIGKLVWQFSTAGYVAQSDLVNRRMPDGRPTFDEHLNAFFFDSVNGCIYLGFRNISRILKVSYPGGRVLAEFGARYNSKGVAEGEVIFCHQHAMFARQDSLYLFNNNGCSTWPIPEIQVLVEDKSVPCGMKSVWKYSLSSMAMPVGRSSGGNIALLPGGDFFASLSLPYNDLVIVSRNNMEKWRASPMHRQAADKPWQSTNNYRASAVSSEEELRRLISGGVE